ncbi:MAG: hypothetical protein JWN78_639 [Bacteroidota bacterium]|nr:hypothetical protein [Bacteroidota bacterium]
MKSTSSLEDSVNKLSLQLEQMLELLAESPVEAHSRSTLKNSQKQFPNEDRKVCIGGYLTRKEAAKFLGVSLVTLHKWSTEGIVQSHRINTRIKYKKEELEASVKPVQNLKYKRGIV